jgi:hypothetical protein
MKRAYRLMLLLYPRGHRDRFAEEMAGVFDEARNERHYQGWVWYARFAFFEIAGLIGGAAEAWVHRQSSPEAASADPAPCALPPELAEAQQRVDSNVAAMIQAIANHQFERARVLSGEERRARETLQLVRQKYGISG